MTGAEASVDRWREQLAPLLSDPAAAAVMCDLDGTLAPIVARPELVEVPARALAALAACSDRFGLAAIVTGRRAEEARRIVGLAGFAYAGNHGFELLEPGSERSTPSPELAGVETAAMDFLQGEAEAEALAAQGIRIEDKGPIVALHWRGAADEPAAEGTVARLAATALERGLVTHAGRKVLELRPPVAIDKGVAIEGLLSRAGSRTALYAGDDRTDVDGFAALARMRDAGALEAIVRVGVSSPEGPPELVESADLVVAGTDELIDLLEVLAGS